MWRKLSIGAAALLGYLAYEHIPRHRAAPAVEQARASSAETATQPAAAEPKVRIVYPPSAGLDSSGATSVAGDRQATSVAGDRQATAQSRAAPPQAPANVPARSLVADAETGSSASKSSDLVPAQPAAPEVVPAPPSQAVNINTAPINALNHIEGAGLIGAAIARHRPYRSVEDLVRKRVLRKSVYEHIRAQLAAE
jgi:DNA uptake protein ComE-like DNA-binding protein